ncbi:sigma-70 family RNA polymerase sigma factor [Epibacterium sp. SM1969]|uniref:Sigma-70 family RNA polymerase sigma factor n=1 Tax=Tritonibacter aquimaris TaxID=2663379 RepID=A0A844AN45_9RHOB|nr:sigma-70 family RNA polymerase sigma factor [Tritonibacter aquimaris]MQY43910.1 sigma-70 family RNA polymerase sigma factor [Tritonibacter aquimaris]
MLTMFMAHQRGLRRYAAQITGDSSHAEDLVQEAWLRFTKSNQQEHPNEPISYLYRIVRNLALDARRHSSRAPLPMDPHHIDEAGLSNRLTSETVVVARDDLRVLMEAIEELPARTRKALELHRFGGLKLREIADRMEISTSRAHELVSEGLAHCRDRVNGEEQ